MNSKIILAPNENKEDLTTNTGDRPQTRPTGDNRKTTQGDYKGSAGGDYSGTTGRPHCGTTGGRTTQEGRETTQGGPQGTKWTHAGDIINMEPSDIG